MQQITGRHRAPTLPNVSSHYKTPPPPSHTHTLATTTPYPLRLTVRYPCFITPPFLLLLTVCFLYGGKVFQRGEIALKSRSQLSWLGKI